MLERVYGVPEAAENKNENPVLASRSIVNNLHFLRLRAVVVQAALETIVEVDTDSVTLVE